MSYDEAKALVFETLVPKKGQQFIQPHLELVTVTSVSIRRGGWLTPWVIYKRHSGGGGSLTFSEWWRWLNEGRLERLDEDVSHLV